MSEIKDYGEDIQELFLRFLVTDPDVFVRVNTIVEPYMFNRKFRDAVTFLKDHANICLGLWMSLKHFVGTRH